MSKMKEKAVSSKVNGGYVPGSSGHVYQKRRDPHHVRSAVLTIAACILLAALMAFYQKLLTIPMRFPSSNARLSMRSRRLR